MQHNHKKKSTIYHATRKCIKLIKLRHCMGLTTRHETSHALPQGPVAQALCLQLRRSQRRMADMAALSAVCQAPAHSCRLQI